jgi:ABC-2 type transport system permease protein
MAVYKRTYSAYSGALTPHWSRFLVIARFAFEELRRSRFLTLFFLASFLWPVISAFVIYLQHNLQSLKALGIEPPSFLSINARFFLFYLGFQSMLAFFLNAFTGPGLVSPDLSHNALPLYLSRPFSRAEYVLGKITVLLGLYSLMTWIPGLLLYGLQAYLAGAGWFTDNLRIAGALLAGSGIWILVLALMSLAISAWVKWKPAAGALLFGLFFVGLAFGAAINTLLQTKWGNLINLSHLIGSVWVALFEDQAKRGTGAVFFRVMRGQELPLWCCWAALLGFCVFCLWLLHRKIRAVEVVR